MEQLQAQSVLPLGSGYVSLCRSLDSMFVHRVCKFSIGEREREREQMDIV